ncbi:MAG: peptidylprolyl isomerase [Bacteroidales bacterium]|nr:peptidylprolyl isomerase [Bacteroidales bacterium]
MNIKKITIAFSLLSMLCLSASAQKYQSVVDKSVAVVGGELIPLSDIESEVQMLRARGYASDRNIRCELLENMMKSKIFLMQSRLDSLTVNQEMVEAQLSQQMDQVRTALGGDDGVADYFGKPVYKLRQEWRKQLEENTLTQQEQQEIAKAIPEVTPYDVKQYLDTSSVDRLPMVPTKYKISQICIYPDREAAAMAVKERLLNIRERILNGEKFSTLARLYSEDTGSARKGGELGMASKSIFWSAFSDAAMSLKPGAISQIVETPDGYHIIEVLEKKGDMFNARHILLKPQYTAEDRAKAFKTLDSLKTAITDSLIQFELAARFYSEDPATRTNGGQMADPNTGSAYFEIDQIKPQDYAAVRYLEPGQISDPVESLDNEGRDGNLVYKILRLDSVIPAHTASFERDYTELKNEVMQAKQMQAIDNFIKDKIKVTYIKIDPLFGDCEFQLDGWKEKIAKD